ncbi:MAG: acetylornithine deacetylase [Actinomycetota bacterium]|jgi:acetylornithine deacetylase|nr:acetylornithine deacetylase [Actinomycetota bacterium]
MTDWRSRVLDEVDAALPEATGLLAELVQTPSVGGTDPEHEIQARLARELTGLEVDHWRVPLDELLAEPDFPGVEVKRTEAWGLVGRLPGRGDAGGAGQTLLLNGHVDVVPIGDPHSWSLPDAFSGHVAADMLYGRGACDMKAGLVAALTAVQAVRRAGVPLLGDLLLACVPGEEDGGLGTYAMLRRGWRADLCVVPEPTSLDLVTANAGALTFRLRVPGQATHASRRTEGVSAVEKFVPVLAALRALEDRRNGDVDPLMARWPIAYPLSIGRVFCGDWPSTVPDLLVAEGRLGVALDEPVATARESLEEAVADACAADPWLRDHPVTVEWWGGQFASGRLPESSDLAARVAAAHVAVGGAPQQTSGAPYGSDLRLLTGLGGIPTLHYGPGDAALAHAPDERVPLGEVATTARALAVLTLDVCGTA